MQKIIEGIDRKCELILSTLEGFADKLLAAADPGKKEDDTVLDYLDVCQILHISVRHLRRLQQGGELTGFKIGRRRFYLSSEVQKYLRRKNHMTLN